MKARSFLVGASAVAVAFTVSGAHAQPVRTGKAAMATGMPTHPV